jgi:diguanylate cyclase (GGDEF)-like protein/PAS domain S-box-containing protein
MSCWLFILLIIRPLLRKVIESEHAARKQQKLLQESERRFYSAFAYASIGMALVDLGGNLLKVNEALCKITGYTKKELMAISLREITYPDDLEVDRHYFNDLSSGKIKWYQVEKRYINKKGNVIWILLNSSLVRDIHNQPVYVIKQIQDITKQKEAEKQLVYLSQHDPLTGLSNRAALELELKKIIDLSRRNKKMFAIFFMDLDKFKEVNDTFGHVVGDELLKYIADRLKNSIRITDRVARLGGDEFIIILTDINSIDTVKMLAEKIINNFTTPVIIKGHILETTISIGISIYPMDGEDILSLLNKADQTLYVVKKSGRKGYRFYNS